MDRKYEALLDQEMLDFVRKTELLYSSNAIDMTIQEHRTQYDKMAEYFRSARPPELLVEDKLLSGVPVRIYLPPNQVTPIIIYLHGGGFMLGSLESHDDVCAEIASETNAKVIAIDYALFPEKSFFDALEDCSSVMTSLSESSQVILVGDSAGGMLAANLSRHFVSEIGIKVIGQILIYPGLGGDGKSRSYELHGNAPLLTKKDVSFYRDQIFGGFIHDEFGSGLVLQNGDFTKLPPTIVFSAEFDPLSDDGKEYCDRIRKNGGRAKWYLELGLVHGYLRARHISHRAGTSFTRILHSIGEIANNNKI